MITQVRKLFDLETQYTELRQQIHSLILSRDELERKIQQVRGSIHKTIVAKKPCGAHYLVMPTNDGGVVVEVEVINL